MERKEIYKEELFYDKANNRVKRIANGVEELYAYDNRNRLTKFTKNGQETSFKWDNAGNLLQDDKANYTYNDFNQTTKVETFDGNIQINRYDAEGLRYEMEENGQLVQFIFNTNKEVIAEKENEWTIYIRGSELLASSSDYAKTYYHYANDEMGSCTHIVDDREILNQYEYDAWGNITSQKETIKNRFKFNGQQLDPITQQYYLRARFYNPVIARFTQEDTYRGDGLNLYSYCANNPIYYVDPSGNACEGKKTILEKIKEKLGFNKNRSNSKNFKEFANKEEALKWGNENYLKWLNNLSDNNKELITKYTGTDLYKKYNGFLRDNIKVTNEIKNEIKKLQNILNKSIVPENIIVYRGVDFEHYEKYLKVGNIFEEKAFMSTSLLKSQSFNNKDLILKINVPKGANGAFIRDLSEFPEEYELLFSPGQNLLVKSIRDIPNNKKIVEVDLVLKK